MSAASSGSNIVAISPLAGSRQQRQHLAEPLWFALMCREILGVNSAKELKFNLDKVEGGDRSERTCRAWASGDSEPPAGILVALLNSELGSAFLAYVMQDSLSKWWRELEAARELIREFEIKRR